MAHNNGIMHVKVSYDRVPEILLKCYNAPKCYNAVIQRFTQISHICH